MKTPCYSVIALLAGTALASAQSLGGMGYVTGEMQFEYGWANGGSGDLTRADLALGLDFGGVSAGRFGAELGLKGYFSAEGSNALYALFPTLWYEGGYGRLTVGVPRSAMADRVAMPKFGGSYMTHSFTEMFFNFTEAAQMFHDDIAYGIRYDTVLGGYDLGVSYHHFDQFGVDMLTAGIARNYGAWDFAIGFEAMTDDIADNNNIAATLGYDNGVYGARLTAGQTGMADGFGYALDAFYRPVDKLKLEATYANYDFAGIGSVYGVNAEYAVFDTAVLGAGYVRGDYFGDIYGVYLRWNLDY